MADARLLELKLTHIYSLYYLSHRVNNIAYPWLVMADGALGVIYLNGASPSFVDPPLSKTA